MSMTRELKPIVEDINNIISIFKAIPSCITSKGNLARLAREQAQSVFGKRLVLFMIFEGIFPT